MVKSDLIDIADIPLPYNPVSGEKILKNDRHLLSIALLKDAKREFEREYIRLKLLEHDNNVAQTAKAIGVERSYMHKKIKRIMPAQEKA
jgi:two-component system nitrogen regulation response regulator NtrX